MALDDRAHVEAVSIMRNLADKAEEAFHSTQRASKFVTANDIGAARQWLRENHPTPEAYVNALVKQEATRCEKCGLSGVPLYQTLGHGMLCRECINANQDRDRLFSEVEW